MPSNPLFNDIKAVVFDWDGTLMDSVAHIVASMRLAVADMDWEERSEAQLRDIIGLGLLAAGGKLFPGRSVDELEQLSTRYRHHYFGNMPRTVPLFPGADQLLADLYQQKYWLAVATGKGRRGLDAALAMHPSSKYFVVTKTAEETASKPDPMMLRELAAELAIQPNEMVMIGDSQYDLHMAQNFGCPSIGVTWGVHNRAELALYKPVETVDSLAELAALLRR